MSAGSDQSAELKFVVTNTLIVRDIKRLGRFLSGRARGTVLREGELTFLRLGNLWLTINGGGGGTDDKPDVVAAPPRDPNVLSNFINLRVIDKTLLRTLVVAGREVRHRAQSPRNRDAVLHARSGRLPHCGRTNNHDPGLDLYV